MKSYLVGQGISVSSVLFVWLICIFVVPSLLVVSVVVLLLLLFVFLSISSHSQLEFLPLEHQIAIHLCCHHQVLLSETLHERKPLLAIFTLDSQVYKPDSFFIEEFLKFICISLRLKPSDIKLEIVVNCLIILLLCI